MAGVNKAIILGRLGRDPEVRNFQNGGLTASQASTSYEYWLPSVNLKLEVGGGLQFRAAYFAGVAPPATGVAKRCERRPSFHVSQWR